MLKERVNGVEPRKIRHLSLPDRVGLFLEKTDTYKTKLQGEDKENYEALVDTLVIAYASQTQESKDVYEYRANKLKERLSESKTVETMHAILI